LLPARTLPLLLALVGVPAMAQMPATEPAASPVCTASGALPAELAGWASPSPLVASSAEPVKAPLTLGRAVTAALLPTPKVRYPLRPEKPGGSVSYGGLFTFTVAAPGRYRVALGSGAWIDVVKDGTAMTSVAHGHGPDCTDVHKMVDFDLQPGRYLLQVAGNGTATLPLMVVKLPA
jgi:hypothetical protein